LLSNKKKWEGKQHTDRNEQFNHINNEAIKASKSFNPVVSADSKSTKHLVIITEKVKHGV
jgi:hypothetical protein